MAQAGSAVTTCRFPPGFPNQNGKFFLVRTALAKGSGSIPAPAGGRAGTYGCREQSHSFLVAGSSEAPV